MNITPAQIQGVIALLSGLATTFDIKNVEQLRQLLAAGQKFNELLNAVKSQTETDAPEVWEQVRADYEASVQGLAAAQPPADTTAPKAAM